ncbi:MAG: hypothetical protein P4L92_13515 [Rudaea sp.]|nr:hypothetical protein [Rudaea sp.]
MSAAIVEKLCALRRADQMLRQRPCFHAAAFIEFAEMRHRLLDDAPPDPHAAHQPPVAVNLAALSQRRVAQIHGGGIKIRPADSRKHPWLALHAKIRT